ncbi:MAG: hypothetical protein ACRC62_18560 [Microcoleus sp.]
MPSSPVVKEARSHFHQEVAAQFQRLALAISGARNVLYRSEEASNQQKFSW